MVKVSVIVPVYNVDKYLEECLDSIINQTLKDIEIICVNDGSTDGSLKILEDYASNDDRIKIITQENGGLSVARNTGIDAAIGEYISFVDSDDFIELSMFDKMYNQAHSQDLDIILCKSYLYDDITKDIEKTPYFSLEFFDNFDKDVFNHFDTVDFTHRILVTAWAKLFKREFISKNNFKFPPRLVFEDTIFYYETYLNASRVGVCPEFFYFYRVNRENSIIESNKDFTDVILIFRLIRQFLSQIGLLSIYKINVYIEHFTVFYIRFSETSDKFKDKFFDLMKDEFNQLITEDIVDGDDFRINIYDLPKYLQNKINNTLKAKNYLEFNYLELLDENNSLKVKNKKLSKKNKKLKKQLKKEKNKTKNLLNSNSWKITKPLRMLKR